MSGDQTCPKGHSMAKRDGGFYYRGRSYSVDFCPTCNSLWNCPPPEFMQDVANGVFDGTQPGDRVGGAA